MTTLYTQRRDAVSLINALAAFPNQPLIGYCMTPAKFVFARWNGTGVETADGMGLDQVYEARFFDKTGELRWLRDPAANGVGSAVWIAESETKLAGWMPVDCLDVETLPNSNRLLTGTLAESHETLAAWRWTNAPRHGKGAVPVSDGNKGQRLAYVVREYRGSAPGDAGKDGNKIVVEERIIEIMAVGEEL